MRFRTYEALLNHQAKKEVVTYVVYSGDIKNPISKYNCGINTYKVNDISMVNEDGDKVFYEIIEKLSCGNDIDKQDIIKLTFTPVMGGKDSMSGTFKGIDVPPTLVSFAVDTVDAKHVVSPEFKKYKSKVVMLYTDRLENDVINFDELKKNLSKVNKLIHKKQVLSTYALGYSGICEAISKMAFGNKIGFVFENVDNLFSPGYGNIVLELENDDLSILDGYDYIILGTTSYSDSIVINNENKSNHFNNGFICINYSISVC